MTRSVKAVLLSGLVFPGVGHLFLQRYLRGSILALVALLAVSAMVQAALQQAEVIADRVLSGEVPLEVGAISELIAGSAGDSQGLVSSVSMIVLVGCWLTGIIDSYRVGVALEKDSGA